MNEFHFGHVLIGVLVGWLLGVFVCEYGNWNEYKDGQVDALTGNIKYELTEHPDSTKTWEEIGD